MTMKLKIGKEMKTKCFTCKHLMRSEKGMLNCEYDEERIACVYRGLPLMDLYDEEDSLFKIIDKEENGS